MSAIGGAAPVHSALDENARDDLPTFIEDKRVIPIVGPELLEANRSAEAQAPIVPLIRAQRRQIASGADDQFLRVELASSLLASGVSDPGTRQASLKKARQMLDALPATLQSFSTVTPWRARIQEAQAGHA